jgi:hypothetical protein
MGKLILKARPFNLEIYDLKKLNFLARCVSVQL